MENFIHKSIKRFSLNGQIYDDKFIPRLKTEYINILSLSMRSSGYVQRIDIDSDFTLLYNGKNYDFTLSVYGIYVGRKKASLIWAVDKNKPILFTHQDKLKELYLQWV